MKKIVGIVLSLVTAVSMCACSKNSTANQFADDKTSHVTSGKESQTGDDKGNGISDSDRVERNSTDKGQPSDKDAEEVGELKLLTDDTLPYENSFATEEGYYYLSEDGFLKYIDYKTQREIYLCTDVSCRHNSEKCTARFTMDEFGTDSMIFVWKGYLYFLSRDYDNDGASLSIGAGDMDLTEYRTAALYRMNPDGSGREKVYSFEDNQVVEKIVMADSDALYFIVKFLKSEDSEGASYTSSSDKKLVQYDVKKHQISDKTELDKDLYQVVGCSGSKLVFLKNEYPDGMSDEDIAKIDDSEFKNVAKNSTVRYISLDIHTGEKMDLAAFKNEGMRSTGFVSEGYLYYSDCFSGKIMKTKIETGEEQTLCETDKNYIFWVTDDVLCCMGAGEDSDFLYYYIDKQTGEIRQSTLAIEKLGWSLELRAANAEDFLVVYKYDAKDLGDGSYDIQKKHFALISKKDMYESRANYREIKQ